MTRLPRCSILVAEARTWKGKTRMLTVPGRLRRGGPQRDAHPSEHVDKPHRAGHRHVRHRRPLFPQVKEATTSVLEDHLPRSRFKQHGERAVHGQRLMQAASHITSAGQRGIAIGVVTGLVQELTNRHVASTVKSCSS